MSVNIIMQSYPVKSDERREELLYALRKNLDNSAVKSVHNIMEPGTKLPDDITSHPKFVGSIVDTTKTKKTSERILMVGWVPCPESIMSNPSSNNLSKRITFKYVFDYIRETFGNNEVVAIMNDDIVIEDNEHWRSIDENFFSRVKAFRSMSLCRHEGDTEGNVWAANNLSGGCSDCWVFKTPLLNIKNCNFCVGNAPTCDNAIASCMVNAGYQVFNQAHKYKIIHIDRIVRPEGSGGFVTGVYTDWSFPAYGPTLRGDHTTWVDVCPYYNWDHHLDDESSLKGIYRFIR